MKELEGLGGVNLWQVVVDIGHHICSSGVACNGKLSILLRR